MKRFMSMLILTVLLSVGMMANVFAAGNVSVSSINGQPGDTVSVKVTLSGNTGFDTLTAGISYDSSALELQGLSVANGIVPGAIVGTSKIAYSSTTVVTADGELFTATFKIKDGATAGSYSVTANVEEIGKALEGVSSTSGSGSVSITVPCKHANTEVVGAVEATCEDNGYTGDTKCKDCGETIKTGSVIEALGHDYKAVGNAVEATCETDGYTGDEKCANCGDTKLGEVIKATGHDWKWVVDKVATEEEEGLKHQECKNCGEKQKEGTVIPKVEKDHKHSFGAWQKDANNHWRTCECGKTEKAAHTFDWVVDKKATAKEAGKQHQECSVCGYAKAAVAIPATGQELDNVPQTGDMVNPALVLAMVVVLGGAAVLTVQKKRAK